MQATAAPEQAASGIPRIRIWAARLAAGAAVLAALLAVQVIVPRAINPYEQQILVLAGINIILAVSLNLINGITGQFSLGHAGFMAIGAYTSAVFTYYAGPRLIFVDAVVFFMALLLGALAAGLAGLLVGLPSLRLRGDYLAIVTLGFNQIIVGVIRNIEVVGGARGFTNLTLMTSLLWVYGMAILCILCVRNLGQSSLGRSMRAVREDEVAAEAVGINTTGVKVQAFVISSMWAGVAGGLYVHSIGLAHPNDFTFLRSIEVVVMVVLGGLGSITGSTITAVLLRFLEERLKDVTWAYYIGQSIVLLAAILSLPRYRAQMKSGMAGWLLWLRWPVVTGVGINLLFYYGRDFLEANVAALRYVLYALILIVLMLLRPQGLLGRGELGWSLLRRRRDLAGEVEPVQTSLAG